MQYKKDLIAYIDGSFNDNISFGGWSCVLIDFTSQGNNFIDSVESG